MMAYKKILSVSPGDSLKNTQIALNFLVEKLGGAPRHHPFHDNLVMLDGRSWWVIPAASSQGVDLCNGRDEDPRVLMKRIKHLQAGVLIFRQMVDHRICLYQLADLEKLEQRLNSSLILLWDTIEIIKSSSDIGIIVGNELIGFRKMLNKPPTPIWPRTKMFVDD